MHAPMLRIFLAVFLSGLAGCETMNTTERARPTAPRQMVEDKRIETDANLRKKACVVGVNQGATPSGLLQVQVELYNDTATSHTIHYKFEWFDANGMLMPAVNPSYTQRQIIGKESLFISSVAPTREARDFRLKLLSD